MSHDQNVFHAMLGKNYLKTLMDQSLSVLVCLINRDKGLTNYVQVVVLGH